MREVLEIFGYLLTDRQSSESETDAWWPTVMKLHIFKLSSKYKKKLDLI